jgi:hypothetical protein
MLAVSLQLAAVSGQRLKSVQSCVASAIVSDTGGGTVFGFALGKAYRQLPRNNGNFEQLASNVEWLANRLLDDAVRTNHGLNAPSRWEWRLGMILWI